MISVSEDCDIDYELTARLATDAFASPDVTFSADRLRWFYERSFARGTIILAIFDDGVKVGHAALVRQLLMIGGLEQSAAQFVDLFILKSTDRRDRCARFIRQSRINAAARAFGFCSRCPTTRRSRSTPSF